MGMAARPTSPASPLLLATPALVAEVCTEVWSAAPATAVLFWRLAATLLAFLAAARAAMAATRAAWAMAGSGISPARTTGTLCSTMLK